MQNNSGPAPQPTPISEPYWNGLMEKRLMLQHCADCGRLRHYPMPVCDTCYSMKSAWAEASGKGTLHSWTVAWHAFHPGFISNLPYILGTIDLDEGVRMHAPIRDTDSDDLRIGLPVRMVFEAHSDGFVLPAFVPAR